MLKRICGIIFLGIIVAIFSPGQPPASLAQGEMTAYKDNNCVSCHSNDAKAGAVFPRYAEWHISTHKDKGVGCDKCHGGDPTAADPKKAHVGVIKSSEPQSRLHLKNLPETCNACHAGIVNAFVESKHYQKLKASGMGPSCATCHTHMATNVLYTPGETAALCAQCHNAPNKLLPQRPDIPEKASEAMQAIRQANTVVLWAERLVTEGRNKKVDISVEEQEMQIVRVMLADAKVGWHAFNLEAVRNKANAAFEKGTKLKDDLRQKLSLQ